MISLPHSKTSSQIFAAICIFSTVLIPNFAAAIDIQQITTPKGIKAWLVEDYTIPIISINFAFQGGGSSQDPEGHPGTAYLMSGLLDEGAGSLDSQEFQARLKEKSIELSFDARQDNFYGSMRTLAKNQTEAFELLALALNKPRFDAEPIDRVKAQIIAGLRQAKNRPSDIAVRQAFTAMFSVHPYGRPSKGTEESIESLTQDNLKTYHRRIFSRQALKISVVGAVDAKSLASIIDKVFLDLPAKSDFAPISPVSPQIPKDALHFNIASPQTIIWFAGQGLAREDKDFIPAYVMNHVLGGGSFTSRLYEEVREKRGLAYSIYSYLNPLKYSALFVGTVSTRKDQAGTAVELVKKELKRMGREGPSQKELTEAKNYLIGSFPLRFDTSSKIGQILLGLQIDGRSADYIENRNTLIEAVTIADVRRAAKRILDNKPLLFSIVGPDEDGQSSTD